MEKTKRIYREVQVKYGKLHRVGTAWEKKLFDLTSWRFFRQDEFDDYVNCADFFVAYVLAADIGYAGDIFVFPVAEFARLISFGISSKSQRKSISLDCVINRIDGFFGANHPLTLWMIQPASTCRAIEGTSRCFMDHPIQW